MIISVLQEGQNSGGSSLVSSISVTLTGVTAGSFIHVVCANGFNSQTITLSDSNSDTVHVLGTALDGTNVENTTHAWFGPVAAGSITFTGSWAAATGFNAIWVREIGGCSGVQASSNITAAGTTIAATVSAQPALWSALGANYSTGIAPTASTGTQDIHGWGFGGSNLATTSHQRVTATGSVSATFATSTTTAIAIFTEAAGGGAIAGTAAVTFGQSGALTGSGALAATEAIVFGQSGALKGAAAAAGTTAITFGTSATLAGAGALSASAAVTFGANGTLAASGALVGATAIVFDASGTLTPPSGAISGTSSISFGAAGTSKGSGALLASAAITFGTSGALKATGVLAGLGAVVFGAAATLTQPGAITGTASFSFGASGALSARGTMVGSAPITWAVFGTIENANGGLQMPSLVGLNFYEALQVLQGLGIYLPLPTYAFAPSSISVAWQKTNSRGGYVTAQSIPAGIQVVPSAPIELTVSTFPFGSVIDTPPDWKQVN